MPDYRTMDKTEWFIGKMSSEWFSRRQIVERAAAEFPSIPWKTLDGTIGQYWSDSVNPKWSTYKAIRARGLKVVAKDGRRRIMADGEAFTSRAAHDEVSTIKTFPSLFVRAVTDRGAGAQAVVIDDPFIREWHPKYDWTESDEPEYRSLVDVVARDMDSRGTISKETFLAIWKWKGALRVIGQVRMDEYDTRYAEAFRRAASEPPERRLAALLAPGMKLPGLEAPTGSTLIHFIHPQSMPIIDVRTVEVLFRAGLVSTERRDLAHYEEFRHALEGIRRRCPNWSLREIDRALFAYHKQVLDKKGRGRRCV